MSEASDMLAEATPIVDNKVELLRAVERTVGQVDGLIGWPMDVDAAPTSANTKEGLPCSIADGTVNSVDKEFLESFKKILHIGYDQLESFIDLVINLADIDVGSSESGLGVETLLYYIHQLRCGPMKAKVKELSEGKTYFKKSPDSLGVMGNIGLLEDPTIGRPNSSTSVVVKNQVPLNASPDTFNKCPKFIQDLLQDNSKNVQEILNSNTTQLNKYDGGGLHTAFGRGVPDPNKGGVLVPWRDGHERREVDEAAVFDLEDGLPDHFGNEAGNLDLAHDGRNHRTHADIGVKDVEFFNTMLAVYDKVLTEVMTFLGDGDWKIYMFKKKINYFNQEQNIAQSENNTVARITEYISHTFQDEAEGDEAPTGEEEITTKFTSVETDLFGNTFTSADLAENIQAGELMEARMNFELTVPEHGAEGEDGTFKLYTVKGQLGSGEDVSPEEMPQCNDQDD